MRDEDIMLTFGRNLRHCRQLLKLTQEDLGEKSELSPKYIGEIERGEKIPSLKTLRQLAIGLSIDVSELVSFSELQESYCQHLTCINQILRKRDSQALYTVLKVMRVVFGEETR